MRKLYRVRRHAVTQPSDPSYRFIPLTGGKNAIVDTSDFKWLSQWNWQAHFNKRDKRFYATGKAGTGKHVFMHRLILQCKKGEIGDHKNGNTLDNRRENLRRCTSSQNSMNRCRKTIKKVRYKGVFLHWKKWRALIRVNGKLVQLGVHSTQEEAARAYDEAAKIFHGEFAFLNFPKSS